jgi:magnesium chelatase family protein
MPERYLARISGPLRDRIDVWVQLPRVPAAVLTGAAEPESSSAAAARIAAARDRQLSRQPHRLNAWVSGRALRAACHLDPEAEVRLVTLAEGERLSGRGTDRLLRVARTIADLADEPAVRAGHLAEAARYRSPLERLAALAV